MLLHARFGVGGNGGHPVVFVTGMVMGLALYIIGSLMERGEKARHEREWKDRCGK